MPEDMPEITGTVPTLLSALRTLPHWLLVGIAFAGYAVLFAPPLAGIKMEPFREQWGPLAWVVAVSFSILACTRIVEAAIDAYVAHNKQVTGRRVLRFVTRPHGCWWHLAKQRDDSFASQVSIDVQVSNTSERPVQIVKYRLIRPRAELRHIHALAPANDGPYHSSRFSVPPHGTVPVTLHLMGVGAVGTQGNSIRVTVGITDQYGEEYKVRRIPVGTRDRSSPRRTLNERLRDLKQSVLIHFPSQPLDVPAPAVMPWAYDSGAEYLDACRSILQEERRGYAARGRRMGGLGSLNIGLRSEPERGWTQEGRIPRLLWNKDETTRVSSPNLDRLLKLHLSLDQQDKGNLQKFLLTQLRKDCEFADVGYFVFLALHRMDRTVDALSTARTCLAGDNVHGYSNLLGTLSALISHEHYDVEDQLYQMWSRLFGRSFRFDKWNICRG